MADASVAGVPGLDPTLPDVPVILGGVERKLCFDFNAIVQAEKVTGINLLKAIVSDFDATKLRGLLWAALLRHDPEVTIDQVGTWLHPRNIYGLHQALLQAWFASVGEGSPKGGAKAPAKKGKAPRA